jgi:hypothetical protein
VFAFVAALMILLGKGGSKELTRSREVRSDTKDSIRNILSVLRCHPQEFDQILLANTEM